MLLSGDDRRSFLSRGGQSSPDDGSQLKVERLSALSFLSTFNLRENRLVPTNSAFLSYVLVGHQDVVRRQINPVKISSMSWINLEENEGFLGHRLKVGSYTFSL